MLDSIIKRWLDLLFWWVPKNGRSGPERGGRTPQASAPAAKEEAATRDETVERPPAAAQRPAPEPPAAEKVRPAPAEDKPTPPAERPAAPATPSAPDDLTVIKGIGPAVQEKLRGLGIATFADLAAADPDRLVDQLKGSQPISKARVEGWTEQARARAGAPH